MESQEPIKGSDGFQPQLVMDFVTKDAPVPLKDADGAETSYLNLGSILKEFPSRRGVSAIRDYPVGWSNVPRFSNESLKETSADNDRVKSDRDVMKTKAECFTVRPIPHSNSAKAVTEENDFKSQATSNIYGSNTSPKSLSKKFDSFGKISDKQSLIAKNQAVGSIIIGSSGERMVAQALMAAKYCPWRYAKVDVKSTTTQGTTRNHVKNQKIVPYTSLEYNSGQIICLDDEKDAQEDDEMIENILSVPKPPCSTLSVIPFGRPVSNNDDVVTRSKVRETLRLFQAMFRKSLQEEESKLKVAGTLMRKQEKWVNTGNKILGHVPGVEVGDEFHYRVELSIIGLHGPFQGGIDYVKKGGYDDIDNFDVLLYSGQGGNPVGGNKKAEDQKLELGNLALKNSIYEKSPVWVIRGFKEMKGPDSKMVITHTYDGLYLVKRYWQEKGFHGNNVYMFELRRVLGQPELALREYIAKMKYPSRHNLIPLKWGCECTDGCSDSEKCLCTVKNGGEIPYDHNGAIVEAKTLVYECGPLCKCPPSCHNRVSQHGIKFQLEIFKTKSRGWGVRSLNSIPSGSFICEYTGELLAEKEADQRMGNDEYLFDLGRSKNSNQSISCKNVEDEGVGRFINHSCSPNLVAQNVLYDHGDKRMPHIMLFAGENIPPLQELTYDYNYVVDSVHDSAGNIKIKECYCGSIECTGRM
ncbi:hypothetical protein MKX01_030127 [Papaver californicum]|nr:hypothetical protein MKX01_030127 [Papaver californicum]